MDKSTIEKIELGNSKKYIMKNPLTLMITFLIAVSGCQQQRQAEQESLKDIAYDAFIYAYPMMEQIKTTNGMMQVMGLSPNQVSMNPAYPMDNVGHPIVAMNLTSMTGGIFVDISGGPVTIEVPEIKDRYVVYQCIDVFTHNFYYIGSRANGGEAGQFVFYNKGQQFPEGTGATPVLMEGDHAIIVNRIDIKSRDELELVKGLQNQIKVVDAPTTTRAYPKYDSAKAFSPLFVQYLNELLTEVPESETEMFNRFAAIGVMNKVELSEEDSKQIQAGIDSAYQAIKAEREKTQIGNGWVGATELFGTREFLNGNYLNRAFGANFGLWGNSKEEANYFMLFTQGEGSLTFKAEELPPLTDIGFWSITMHNEQVFVDKNEYGSYVITMDQMQFEEDGSLVLKFSKEPEEGNWLYMPSETFVLIIRAYQADPEKIGDYVPPAFERR